LAVAMLLLKMMRDQTEGSQEALSDAQRQQAMGDYTQSAQKTCSDLCNDAKDAGCSARTIARYCLARYHGRLSGVEQAGFDINKDYNINGETPVSDIGYSFCEHNIYCSQMTEPPCGCKGGLTMKRCVEELCKYYDSEGMDLASATSEITNNIVWGTCANPAATDPTSWHAKLATDNYLQCPPGP